MFPDLRISEMAPALNVLNGDFIPIERAGFNYKATRELILTAGPGEGIGFSAAGQFFGYQADGTLSTILPAGVQFQILLASGGEFLIDGSGVFSLAGVDNVQWRTSDLSIFNFGAGSPITLIGTFGVECNVNYHPLQPTDWSPQPTQLSEAIDRLAAAVAGLLGGPIP